MKLEQAYLEDLVKKSISRQTVRERGLTRMTELVNEMVHGYVGYWSGQSYYWPPDACEHYHPTVPAGHCPRSEACGCPDECRCKLGAPLGLMEGQALSDVIEDDALPIEAWERAATVCVEALAAWELLPRTPTSAEQAYVGALFFPTVRSYHQRTFGPMASDPDSVGGDLCAVVVHEMDSFKNDHVNDFHALNTTWRDGAPALVVKRIEEFLKNPGWYGISEDKAGLYFGEFLQDRVESLRYHDGELQPYWSFSSPGAKPTVKFDWPR